ncbi:monovalent cation/H+ antiporter subunit D family protein [Sinimarinibacterium thermocellulolyticum]|uniref:Monovalent cation/H+ antiporter subunit D family protein n=1 Tax=Sinimarinibacterium thermocellulolyticum TaxID=3170016 RepID=A0ABV2A761_9GAMM
MIEHLPALQVVIPLLAAPACVLVRHPRAAWGVFALTTLSALVISTQLFVQTIDGGVLRYALGGWPAPFGIEYVVDAANALPLLLVSLLAVAVALYAPRAVEAEIERPRIYLYYACLCLYLAGLLGIGITGDAFNVFVFLEISSLSGYALIAMGRHRRALLAAFRYLVMGTVGGTFVLIGIGLLYALTGSLNMADLAERVPALYGNRALTASLGFIAVGLAIKAAVFPLHAWQPDAYSQASSAASVLLAGAGAKIAIYAFVRYAFGVFGTDFIGDTLPLAEVLLTLGVIGMLVGSAVACFQHDVKRLLAWSSIGQIGYIVAGIGLADVQGLTAAFLHLFNHGLIKGGLFAVAGIVMLRTQGSTLDHYAGLAKRMPGTFAALLLGGLGLVGVPLTAGFVSKWALAQALISAGQWSVLAAMLVSSLLALVYVGRIIEAAWFREPPAGEAAPAAPGMSVAAWLLVLLTLWIAVDSAGLADVAGVAARGLLGGAS